MLNRYWGETESFCQLQRVAFRELQVRTISLIDEVDVLALNLGDLLVNELQNVVFVLDWQAFRSDFLSNFIIL
jgi:hypothetical protein